MSDDRQETWWSNWEVRCAADYEGHMRILIEQTDEPFMHGTGRKSVRDIDMAKRFGALRVYLGIWKAHRIANRRNRALKYARKFLEKNRGLAEVRP